MCVTAVIAAVAAVTAVATAGVGMVTKMRAATANQAAAQYEAGVRTKELYNQRESARIATLQEENGRQEQFFRARSEALAAIGASGLGEHISFFQGADPAAQAAFLRDVRSLRLNLAQRESTIADEVGVTQVRRDIAVYNGSLEKIGAIADFIKTAANAASFYAMNATGAPAAASGGGGDSFSLVPSGAESIYPAFG